MRRSEGRWLCAAIGALFGLNLFASCVQTVSAQATRTIKVIVPFPPGGSADLLGRLLSEQIARNQGPAIVIENRGGAGTAIGTEAASRAAPDGNTVLLTNNGFVINPQVRKLSYDPLTSFEPVCNLVSVPMLIVVDKASPYRTLGDLIDAAKAKPGQLTLATTGPATASHLAVEILKRRANADITFVPFAGNAPAVNALLGSHVTSVLADYPTVAEHIRAGTLRALALTSPQRIKLVPDVPTIAELGFKDFEAVLWNGLLAPAGTPKETVAQLAAWFSTAMQGPDIKAKLLSQGQFPDVRCGADFDAYLRAQHDGYRDVIRAANIKSE